MQVPILLQHPDLGVGQGLARTGPKWSKTLQKKAFLPLLGSEMTLEFLFGACGAPILTQHPVCMNLNSLANIVEVCVFAPLSHAKLSETNRIMSFRKERNLGHTSLENLRRLGPYYFENLRRLFGCFDEFFRKNPALS